MIVEERADGSPAKSSKPKKRLPKPPDGGWGWWVVVASFLIHVVADGVTYTFGVFVKEIIEDLHLDRGVTSWIQSIMAGMTYGVGPIAGAVTNKYGCRIVSIAGSILAAFGFAISYFASNIYVLYLTIGIIGGLGLGLIYLPAIVCVTCYFEKRRAFATGIAVCGSGFGTMIFAPIVNYIIQRFKWRLSLVIVGGLILTNVLFSLFFKPLTEEEDAEDVESDAVVEAVEQDANSEATKPLMSADHPPILLKNKFLNISNANETLTMSTSQPILSAVDKEATARDNKLSSSKRHSLKNVASFAASTAGMLPTRQSITSTGMIMNRKDIFYSGSLVNLRQTGTASQLEEQSESEVSSQGKSKMCRDYIRVINKMIGFSLLKNPVFMLFAISNFLTSIGYTVPYVYLVDHAAGENNIYNDKSSSSFLLSVVGTSNTVSRVVLGYLSDKPFVNRLYLYNVALTINGIATGLCAHTHDYMWLNVYSAVFGSTIGVYVSLTSVITVDLLGLEQLTNAFGLLLLFQGVATVIGPPLVGELFDYFKSYIPGFWLAGGMIAVSGVMLFAIPLVQKKPTDNEGTNNEHIVIECPKQNGKKVSNNNLSAF